MKKLLIVLSFLISYSLAAQVDLGYQKPSKAILDLVDVPLPPRMSMNSKGDKALLQYRNSFKTIEELSQKELRLAGLRINPKTNIGSRTRFLNKISLLDV
ncbi:MAG: S9 family peptidase, partial [Saprospiraceae bacterium]|nr:S9 family peptidase [Saprospiraceae bacterium]